MQTTIKNAARSLLVTLAAAVLLWLPQAASAQGFSLVPACAKNVSAKSAPTLDCALSTLTTIARFIFGIMGSAALLMFVVGGFFILASAGREAWVKKGKEYVKNAVIGIVIILTSAYVIEYGVNVLRGGQEGMECKGQVYTDNGGTPDDASDDVQSCCDGVVVLGTTGSNAGKSSCVTSCPGYGTSAGKSYACQNTTERAGGGAGCVGGLCPGNADNLCCPTLE